MSDTTTPDAKNLELERTLHKHNVPREWHAELICYVRFRAKPRSIVLWAMLRNDADTLVSHITIDTLPGVQDLLLWLRSEAPESAWGSPDAYEAWVSGEDL